MNEEDSLSTEDYHRAEQFLPWNTLDLIANTLVMPSWINKTNQFWYQRQTETGTEFVLIDPDSNVRRQSFDHKTLAQALSTVTGTEFDPANLPFTSIEFSEDQQSIEFQIGEDVWVCNLETYTCSKKPKALTARPIERLSPDKKWALFLKENNLYGRNTVSGEEFALTQDGEPKYTYGTRPDYSTHHIADQILGIPQHAI